VATAPAITPNFPTTVTLRDGQPYVIHANFAAIAQGTIPRAYEILGTSFTDSVAFAQDAETCDAALEVMTTDDGVEFVRTPDACFENLPDWDYKPQHVEIDGLRQAYVDVGTGESGETILLLHGQPSWSYLYRKMIPELVAEGHRVIAMDHVGMGRSDKPIDVDYYTYLGHVERLETFIQELELTLLRKGHKACER
jgi:hypothetical protein